MAGKDEAITGYENRALEINRLVNAPRALREWIMDGTKVWTD
jgi:hypothetical protein